LRPAVSPRPSSAASGGVNIHYTRVCATQGRHMLAKRQSSSGQLIPFAQVPRRNKVLLQSHQPTHSHRDRTRHVNGRAGKPRALHPKQWPAVHVSSIIAFTRRTRRGKTNSTRPPSSCIPHGTRPSWNVQATQREVRGLRCAMRSDGPGTSGFIGSRGLRWRDATCG
jgi:hypothetical protein